MSRPDAFEVIMKVEILKNCVMCFDNKQRTTFVFGQKVDIPDEMADILIEDRYARKIGIVESIKTAITHKAVQSDQIENKAIMSDSIENKDSIGSVVSRRGRGRPKKTDE